MRFYILASGSKGNATLVESRGFLLLIDAGLTKTRLKETFAKTPYMLEQVQAVIFTHEHSDHAMGKDFFPEAIRFASKGTIPVLTNNLLSPYEARYFQHLKVTPLPISHDARNPLGFVIEDGESSLVYMTDTGYISEQNLQLMKNHAHYILESNHNVKMLLQTQRSQDLKVRILGDSGHLSNEDSAMFFSEMIGPNTKSVYLAHISEEANTPELALETYQKVLKKRRVLKPNLKIEVTQQYDVVIGGD
ncbi:MAG: MBL fold metallo-hydrolase [Bacilli bacterium]